jgi:hypothetical protein
MVGSVAKKGKPGSGSQLVYSHTVAEEICDRIANGETLHEICSDPHMPSQTVVRQWRVDDVHGFSDRYQRARQEQTHTYVDQIMTIADDGRNDWMARNDPDNPGWAMNGEHIARSRMRIDTRKWYASKILPKLYGERIDATVSNTDGSPLVPVLRLTLTHRIADDSKGKDPAKVIDGTAEDID